MSEAATCGGANKNGSKAAQNAPTERPTELGGQQRERGRSRTAPPSDWTGQAKKKSGAAKHVAASRERPERSGGASRRNGGARQGGTAQRSGAPTERREGGSIAERLKKCGKNVEKSHEKRADLFGSFLILIL